MGSGRVLRMTHAGTAFKRHVDNLVNDLDDGMAAVDELVDPEGGVVTLAFPLSLGSWLVPGLIRVFEAWRDQAAIDAHFQAPHMAAWRAAWPALGVSDRRLSLYEVASEREL